MFVTIFDNTLSVLAVVAIILSLVIFVCLFIPATKNKVIELAGKRGVVFAFIVASIAMLGSLTYSEVIGYVPCRLCWFQRIFMYPQTFLLAVYLFKNKVNEKVEHYLLVLSIPGVLIAAYHYLLQFGVVPEGNCGVVGQSVSCAERFVLKFGGITIPFMAFSAFLLIIAFASASIAYKNRVYKQS